MSIELIANDKLDAVLAREFDGVNQDRKRVLVQSVRNAIDLKQLHKIFSENLSEQELAFYREIVVVQSDDDDSATTAATAPVAPAATPDAAAIAVPEGARAAASKATTSRDK